MINITLNASVPRQSFLILGVYDLSIKQTLFPLPSAAKPSEFPLLPDIPSILPSSVFEFLINEIRQLVYYQHFYPITAPTLLHSCKFLLVVQSQRYLILVSSVMVLWQNVILQKVFKKFIFGCFQNQWKYVNNFWQKMYTNFKICL